MYTINCKGALIDLSVPKVMGIINVTPDSFYDGGKTQALSQIVAQAEKMISHGAAFLDIGGYSSRPGAADVSEEEELKRVVVAVEAIRREFPKTIISVDTFRSSVAKQAVAAGASIVNDISGGTLDDNMFATVAQLGVPYILMHMRGTPQNMTEKANYNTVTTEVVYELAVRIAEAKAAGINDIIADPGFGFAKTREHGFELLQHLEHFKLLETPLLIGISRKSMIYKTLDVDVQQALNGTTALHSIALLKGASILRVHDVKEAVQCVALVSEVLNSQ